MRTHQFTHNNVKFTIRQINGWDFTDSMVILRKLTQVGISPTDEIAQHRISTFAQLVLQTTGVEGDPGFVWCSASAPAADLKAMYDGFGANMGLQIAFFAALNEVEMMTPGADPTDPNAPTPPVITNSAPA